MPEDEINFEVQDRDTTPPQIVDYKVTSKSRTGMSLRASADESQRIYYIASLKGTQPPPVEEIMDPQKRALSTLKPQTAEVQGNEHARITKDTKTYTYHDTYIDLEGLIPDRDYTLFMLPVDLNGNVGEMKQVDFSTNPVAPPVSFKLNAKNDISDDDIKNALQLVTGKLPQRFEITYKQNLSSISTGEQEVTDVLAKQNLEIEILILPDTTGDGETPYDLLKEIEAGLETLQVELPELSDTQDIGGTGREILLDSQRIMYKPQLVEITNFKARFKVQIGYTGTIYGVILNQDEKPPSAIQIRYGLTSENYQIQNEHKVSASLTVVQGKKYVEWPQTEVEFTFLFHSTTYTAYFIADRLDYGSEVLMEDKDIVNVVIKTEKELFKVSDTVELLYNTHGTLRSAGLLSMALLALIFFFKR